MGEPSAIAKHAGFRHATVSGLIKEGGMKILETGHSLALLLGSLTKWRAI